MNWLIFLLLEAFVQACLDKASQLIDWGKEFAKKHPRLVACVFGLVVAFCDVLWGKTIGTKDSAVFNGSLFLTLGVVAWFYLLLYKRKRNLRGLRKYWQIVGRQAGVNATQILLELKLYVWIVSVTLSTLFTSGGTAVFHALVVWLVLVNNKQTTEKISKWGLLIAGVALLFVADLTQANVTGICLGIGALACSSLFMEGQRDLEEAGFSSTQQVMSVFGVLGPILGGYYFYQEVSHTGGFVYDRQALLAAVILFVFDFCGSKASQDYLAAALTGMSPVISFLVFGQKEAGFWVRLPFTAALLYGAWKLAKTEGEWEAAQEKAALDERNARAVRFLHARLLLFAATRAMQHPELRAVLLLALAVASAALTVLGHDSLL